MTRTTYVVKTAVGALFAAFLAGCAGTTRYTPNDYCAKSIDGKMARIVLNRKNQFLGGGVNFRITDAGQPIGDIGPNGQLCWDRYPGKALISGLGPADRQPGHLLGKRSQIEIQAEAGAAHRLVMYLVLGEGIVIEEAGKPE